MGDAAYADDALTVAYATSDLTASGIDERMYESCAAVNTALRSGCGDYLQTAGEVTFAAGSTSALFQVYIVDDRCWEQDIEYLQLTLAIPGAAALQGEQYYAKLRIDDNDFRYNEC